jgi:hypothetical protein
MANKIAIPPQLLVKKDEAQKGKSWHDIARERATKQHGDPDNIPEGDIHAIPKISDHEQLRKSPEETQNSLDSLEQKLEKLKIQKKEEERFQKAPPPATNNPLDEDLLDDWLDD